MKIAKRVGIALLSVILAGILALAILWGTARLDMDKIENQSQISSVYGASGKRVAQLSGPINRTDIKLQSVPRDVHNAFIAAEDARFYDHFGVDPYRIMGALVSNIKSGDYGQGASTITQQLIKLTMLSSDKTLIRKLTEAVLAIKLERVLTKDEILERYLNTVYFGAGAYGIQAASQTYFGMDADKLTLDQGALLAAVIKSPSRYAPDVHPENATKRRALVLSAMVESQFIDEATAQKAESAPLKLVDRDGETTAYPWYMDQVIDEATQKLNIDADELLTGGYRINTAMDESLQSSAEALFKNTANFPGNAQDGTPVEAALVALNPATGEVSALIGGRKYSVKRGLNRASQIARQPGSAFKPISVYAAAVDQAGFIPVSMVEDTERDFGNGYTPKNVGGVYHGTVTLRESLARSLNAASVDLMTKTGISAARDYAQRAGIQLDARDNNLSLALGSLTYGVSPMALCAAYAPLGNGGLSVTPRLIRSIEDSGGKQVYTAQPEAGGRVMKPESAYMITSMLRSAASWGSASKLSGVGFDVAGKTGTVGMDSGNRDIWTVGYTPLLTVAVWMGFDEPGKAHVLPDSASGSNQPAALVSAYLKANKDAVSKERFQMPSSLTEVLIDQRALDELKRPMLASPFTPKALTVKEVFPKGRTPTEVSTVWVEPTRVFDLSGELTSPSVARLEFTALQADAIYRLYRLDKGEPQLVAELIGEPGQKLLYDDLQAYEGAEYYVIPVHAELLREGVLLEGKPSDHVIPPRPFGFRDWIFFQTPEPSPTPVPIPSESPLLLDPTEAPEVTRD